MIKQFEIWHNLQLHRNTKAINMTCSIAAAVRISIEDTSSKSRSVCATVGRPPHASDPQESRPRPLLYNTTRTYDNISLIVEKINATQNAIGLPDLDDRLPNGSSSLIPLTSSTMAMIRIVLLAAARAFRGSPRLPRLHRPPYRNDAG